MLIAISESRRPRRNSVRYPVKPGSYQSRFCWPVAPIASRGRFPVELGNANPPCGSFLFAGRAPRGTNLCGPWPLQSTGGKRARIAVFTTNRDGPGITPTPIATPVNLDGVQIRYFPIPLLRRLYWAPALGQGSSIALGMTASRGSCQPKHSSSVLSSSDVK